MPNKQTLRLKDVDVKKVDFAIKRIRWVLNKFIDESCSHVLEKVDIYDEALGDCGDLLWINRELKKARNRHE